MAFIKAHTSIIGHTGYNIHARNFFISLNELMPVQVRNWTVGSTWKGYTNDEPHNDEPYITDKLKSMLTFQTLTSESSYMDFPLYSNYSTDTSGPCVNIVLNDNIHPYFKENFSDPSIAYNVWETTRQPEDFFNQLKKFDQVWVASEWQKRCTIDQGIPSNRVKVVPEGVDTEIFKPQADSSETDGITRFLVVGRWEYRKSTKEIISSFLKAFPNDETVMLYLKVDNPFANDGLSSTEERLAKFNLSDPRIQIIGSHSQEEYVSLLHTCDVFVSCSRGEGWNLPLIEAMACGLPSIYSDWGAQLEFAKGHGLPVRIIGEAAAGVENEESWDSSAPGNFAEPDFNHLVDRLREAKRDLSKLRESAKHTSQVIRNKFTWQNAAIIAKSHIDELLSTTKTEEIDTSFTWVTCGNLEYMSLIEMLVKSLSKFSRNQILVYGIDCDVPFAHKYPNVIPKRISIPKKSIHDKWYWKQHACLDSIETNETKFIWIDGDVVANYNIDTLGEYFNRVKDIPLPDVHVQKDFIGYYTKADGNEGSQLFNEEFNKENGIPRLNDKAHICMYLYTSDSKWWFEEILKTYNEIPIEDYERLLVWNDEGIDNFLRSKYSVTDMLPVSNFDVSEWDGDLLGTTGKAMEHFLSFWRESGPKNFGKIYGWQYIPADKSQIKYFHGNKNLDFAQFMIDYIEFQKTGKFHESKWFFTGKNEVKDLGEIDGCSGGTLDIAKLYGWDYAIYHEIYNLKDYQHEDFVKIRPGDTVVDLGGNIGVFTRYAYHMGASKIITFEPDRRYFEILKQNAPSNAILFNAAIADKLGKLTLTESSHLGGSNLWHQEDPLQTQYRVNTYTLDYLFETGIVDSIDFLKVDIEGSEIIALQGISDENLARVRNLAVEYHHEHLGFNEELREQFITRLNRLGFNSYLLLCGSNEALQLIYFWK